MNPIFTERNTNLTLSIQKYSMCEREKERSICNYRKHVDIYGRREICNL